MEVLYDLEKIQDYQKKITSEISNKIQKKIEAQQEASDCEKSNRLILNMNYINPFYAGLGCQLHTYASGLKLVLLINYF